MRPRLDYQLDLPIFVEPEVVRSTAFAGYSHAEVLKAQVHAFEILENLSVTPETILQILGVARIVQRSPARNESLSERQLAFPFASACASHQVDLQSSRTRIGQEQLDFDMQILPPSGA